MSGSSSDWSKLRDDQNSIGSLAESLLSSILEIIKSILCIQIETEAFIEIGCYLYRASLIIMELQINPNTPTNVIEIMQFLTKEVDSATSFTIKLEKNAIHKIQSSEVTSIIQQLEHMIRSVGENIGMIPSSTYGGHDYAERAAKALSKEMKDVSFVLSQSQGLKMLISTEKWNIRPVSLFAGLYSRYLCKYPDLARILKIWKVKITLTDELKEHRDMLQPREERIEIETDLYSTDIDVSAMNLRLSNASQMYLTDNLEISKILEKNDSKILSTVSTMTALPQLGQYMEPLYETFFCPLTKRVMDDPVTIESGVTYERKEITEWFDKFEDPEDIVCPKTGQKLKSRNLSTNMALKATMVEWKERNEAARIKVARSALSLASTENMVLEAIDDVQSICKGKPHNKVQVRKIGIIPLLVNFLDYKSRNVRCAVLEMLRLLAEDDEEAKDMIAKSVDITTVIKMLSSSHKPIRHASTLLLLELSRTQFLCENIGTVAGGILMLITAKYKQSDAFTSETANQILKNLERLPDNMKLMAENGYWEPLLTHLIEGTEEIKMEVASYLGEIVLGPDIKIYVAEKASPALLQMVHNGNSLSRNAAFKALKQISGFHPNAKILIEAGIMQIMVEEMFTRTIHNEPMNSKTEASAILANILESGLELENFQVNTQGHTMASDYIVYNIICKIKNTTTDEFNINLIRMLLCLFKSPKASGTIVSVVKEMEASYNLIELINTPNEELGIAAMKLLMTLSAFMGHTLSDRLCKTKGQPQSLIQNPTEITRITEKDAVSVNFLAKLPHQNLTLNLALVNSNVFPAIMKNISQIQTSGTRSSRHVNSYFEGLVGILIRLTTTLYDHQILFTARIYNFTLVLTELLTRSFTDEVQKLSAVGLENLSKQSIVLSRPPQREKTKMLKFFIFKKCISIKLSKDQKFSLCPVHRGVCSSQETFCLIDAEAVERLLSCMDHENVEVIEAALSALSTLLDDRVNVEKSVSFLSEKHAIQQVLNVVKEHKKEALWQKAFWVIERFLMNGGDDSSSCISQDRLLPSILVSAFHHGDEGTKEMAAKILRHLNKMPTLSHTQTFT